MHFHHSFKVKAGLRSVHQFHATSASMKAITPPPIIVQLHRAPEHLVDGDEMGFTLWLGPIPVHWLAQMECVTDTGFMDRQVKGPFKQWEHQHTFIPRSETCTEVLDDIDYQFCSNPILWLIGAGMALGLPALFAYRAWKTKNILESHLNRSASRS
jgi:ligand-binding SRPBCC domain-containing protein